MDKRKFLKDGVIIKVRDEVEYIVAGNKIYDSEFKYCCDVDAFDYDLRHNGNGRLDVMKIYKKYNSFTAMVNEFAFDLEDGSKINIWERQSVELKDGMIVKLRNGDYCHLDKRHNRICNLRNNVDYNTNFTWNTLSNYEYSKMFKCVNNRDHDIVEIYKDFYSYYSKEEPIWIREYKHK